MALTQTGTLADLQQDIIDALQGRTDITTSQIANYSAKAIRELSENYPFEELRTDGPVFPLTIGTSTYPVTNFVNTSTINPTGFDEYSMPESFAIFIDFPTNTVVAPIRYKTPAAIETLVASAVQGIPAWYTRFGQNFRFGPVPNATYSVYLRYQCKHPFTATSPTLLTEKIFLPLDWYDIIAYSAAERIAIIKRWTDQAKMLHDLLYGDADHVSTGGETGQPGLIFNRLSQQQRDEAYNSRSLSIVSSRYNPR